MRFLSYLFFIYLGISNTFSHVLYNNDSNFTIQSSGLLYVEGAVEVDANGYFNNNGAVWVEGDWDNNSTFLNGDANLFFATFTTVLLPTTLSPSLI